MVLLLCSRSKGVTCEGDFERWDRCKKALLVIGILSGGTETKKAALRFLGEP